MLDDAVEEKAGGEKVRIGMVVCSKKPAVSIHDCKANVVVFRLSVVTQS